MTSELLIKKYVRNTLEYSSVGSRISSKLTFYPGFVLKAHIHGTNIR